MRSIVNFYRSHVAGRSEPTHTFFAAVGLILIGVAFAVFDVVAVVLGEIDMNRHMPFMLPISTWFIGAMLIYTLTMSPRQLQEYGRRYPRDRNK